MVVLADFNDNTIKINNGIYIVQADVESQFGFFDVNAQQNIELTVETSLVPIPGAFLLLGSGLIGILVFRRKS